MTLSQNTKSLLAEITAASGNTLKRAMDLGTLIELSEKHGMQETMDDLAFSSKFISKSFDVMQRIGKEGNGYDKLAGEFAAQIKRSQELLNGLLTRADAMTAAHFRSHYLEMNTLTMTNLLQLFHDLSWYKNYLIDHKR